MHRRQTIRGEHGMDETIDLFEYPECKKDPEIKNRLQGIVDRDTLLGSLAPNDKLKVINAMYPVEYKAGDMIILQNDEGNHFYIIEEGEIEIYKAERPIEVLRSDRSTWGKVVCKLKDQGNFGEMALMYPQPRQATVVAKSDVKLFTLDRPNYQRIVMKSAIEKRAKYMSFIKKVPVMSTLSDCELQRIIDALTPTRFYKDQTIIREGDPGGDFFIIENGTVEVYKRDGDSQERVNILHEGDYFGEIALLTNKPRQATCKAKSDLLLLRMTRNKFEQLLGSCREALQRDMALYESYKHYYDTPELNPVIVPESAFQRHLKLSSDSETLDDSSFLSDTSAEEAFILETKEPEPHIEMQRNPAASPRIEDENKR